MKKMFREFHRPSESEFKELWASATVVVDTNVLLQLYRVPKTNRDETISVLKTFGDRLWIPHHVALEFHRNRLKVIAYERKALEGVLSESKSAIDTVIASVTKIELDKRGVNVKQEPILKTLTEASEKVSSALEKARHAQISVSHDDPIREEINNLLEGRVGGEVSGQDELDAIFSEGEKRYANLVPPGFLDTEKDINPADATYVAGGLKYRKKFGDLLIWKQMLQHAIANNIKKIIFVTSDSKDDWWLRYQGQTLGPQPELISETQRNGLDSFWMYSFYQFMEQASQRSKVKISKDTLDEAKEADESVTFRDSWKVRIANAPHNRTVERRAETEFAVVAWLRKRNINAQISGDLFPDFIAKSPLGVAGYEVVYVDSLVGSAFTSKILSRANDAKKMLDDGALNEFHIIVILEAETLDLVERISEASRVGELLSTIVQKTTISSISLGGIWNAKFNLIEQYASRASMHHGARDV